MMAKAVIFDFDGTIADTFEDVVNIIHDASLETKHHPSKEKIRNYIRNKSPMAILHEFKISKLELVSFVLKVRRKLKENIANIKPFPGIKDVVKKLKQKYKLILLTSNNKPNTEQFLKKEGLDIFIQKYYNSSLFGKQAIIKIILKKNKLKPDELICVGDEVRDIEACKKVGCRIIAVAWGFNSRKLLERGKPDYLISSPNQILGIL